MKIILREELDNLGHMGEIVEVANGYARNFLIPKGFAVEANTSNRRAFEHEQKVIKDRARKLYETAKQLAERLSQAKVTLTAKAGEEGKLFGSITSKDIADALVAQGFNVDKKRVVMDEPIKRLGTHVVDIKVASEVAAKVNVEVVAQAE